jgi:hypothetical protein
MNFKLRRPSLTGHGPRHGSSVHFHNDDQLLDLIAPGGLGKTDQPAAQHGHAHAHHLPGTDGRARPMNFKGASGGFPFCSFRNKLICRFVHVREREREQTSCGDASLFE